MKTFRVQFYYTESGTVEIPANNRKEAEKKLYTRLADYGIDRLTYDCKDRDYNILLDAEEVK